MRFCFIVLALMAPLYFAPSAMAAKPSGLSEPSIKPEVFTVKNAIQKAQEILTTLGFYKGPITGYLNEDLNQAIRNYEDEHELEQTGKVTDALIDHLENVGRVKALLKRLDVVREQRKKEAREALLSNPKTRDLINNEDIRRADPTRDKNACFKAPNATCLLEEAVESSRAVFEVDLRDWALGEILAAQVRAGMPQRAIETAARIEDSRLVVAALAKIAITHAKEGKIDEAILGLDLIPLLDRKISVLLEIAKNQLESGQTHDAKRTIRQVNGEVDKIKDIEERLKTQIEVLKVLWGIDQKRAVDALDEVIAQINSRLNAKSKSVLLRQSATAMADLRKPEYALKTLNELPDDDARIPVLMSATRAFLEMERFQAAQTTMERITSDRYRSVLMADFALAKWHNGKKAQALVSFEEAILISDNIKLPFARNYSLSKVAEAMVEITHVSKDLEVARQAYNVIQTIGDDRLKARALWGFYSVLDSNQMDFKIEGGLSNVVDNSFKDIKSTFSRAWILGELAQQHLEIKEYEKANQAMEKALLIAKELKNPWARARVFAKLGAILSHLD